MYIANVNRFLDNYFTMSKKKLIFYTFLYDHIKNAFFTFNGGERKIDL